MVKKILIRSCLSIVTAMLLSANISVYAMDASKEENMNTVPVVNLDADQQMVNTQENIEQPNRQFELSLHHFRMAFEDATTLICDVPNGDIDEKNIMAMYRAADNAAIIFTGGEHITINSDGSIVNADGVSLDTLRDNLANTIIEDKAVDIIATVKEIFRQSILEAAKHGSTKPFHYDLGLAKCISDKLQAKQQELLQLEQALEQFNGDHLLEQNIETVNKKIIDLTKEKKIIEEDIAKEFENNRW